MFENFNSDLIKQWLFVIIRYASPYIAAYLAKKTGLADATIADGIANVLTAINFLWSLGNKWRYEGKVNTALDLAPGTGKETLKDVIAKGRGTGATVAK